MATVTGLTAERMLEIEAASVVDGEIVDGDLILTKHDGTQINAGPLPPGPAGPPGPGAGSIPGEVKLWSGTALPDEGNYGKWVWADGAWYPNVNHPLAAAHIASQWRTFAGASDPGASNFRVPDLRGLVPAGLDAMPGGSRPTPPRLSRAAAIVMAAITGKETYALLPSEIAAHSHPINDPGHMHTSVAQAYEAANDAPAAPVRRNWEAGAPYATGVIGAATTGISVQNNTGGGGAHENVQPTVMVPYIVYLDVV
jgi:microcystin-dependent protein